MPRKANNNHSLLNIELLATSIKNKRGGLALRKTAADIGISYSALCRIEQRGNLSSLAMFLRICRWLDMPTDIFTIKEAA